MAYGPLISNLFSKVLVFANLAVMQAHLTSRFTPAFSRNLQEKLPEHNRVLFSWWGPTDPVLRVFIVGVNLFLSLLLLVPSSRTVGLWAAFALSFVGLYSDLKLKESFVPHTTLFLLSSGALYLAEE
jgi:hypothetical protein